MLKQKNRLAVGKQVALKNSFSTPLFIVKYDTNNNSQSRFGFIVSKTIDKRATVRNKVKRNFRGAIEVILSTITPGKDFLFIVRGQAREKTMQEIQVVIQKAFEEKGLIQ